MPHDQDRIERLEDENERLRRRIREMECELGSDVGAESVASVESSLSASMMRSSAAIAKHMHNTAVERANPVERAKPVERNPRKRLLGTGTFGRVYLSAFEGRPTALKVVPVDAERHMREEGFVQRFIAERPRRVVPFYHCERNAGHVLIHMRPVAKTLRDVLLYLHEKKQHMKADVHRVLFAQMAQGLRELHRRDIVHRDVKPETVLVDTATLDLYICDLGCAKVIPPDVDRRTPSTTYIVSRYYRAPELVIDRDLYGAEIDVWAFGCMLVEACINHTLFANDTNIDVFVSQIRTIGKITDGDLASMKNDPPDAATAWPQFKPRKPRLDALLQRRSLGAAYEALCRATIKFNPTERPTARGLLESDYLRATCEALDGAPGGPPRSLVASP